MEKKHLISLFMIILLCVIYCLPFAWGLDTKYMHFRTIDIDGNDGDWGGVESHLFVTQYREQRGITVDINGTTFIPGNVTLQEGDALGWINNDINTQGNSKEHQISFNVGAPMTWTSSTMDYGESDYIIVEDASDYSYHTSRVQFIYPDGNVSVTTRNANDFTFGIMFANNPNQLYMGILIENVSDDDADELYLDGIDVLFDDYADGAIEGENAFSIDRSGGTYEASDMYYDGGRLRADTSDGESEDIEMDYTHDNPEVDNPGMSYMGDFFFEVAIPIDTTSFRDLGTSPGMQLAVQIVIRLSDPDQKAASSVIGVSDYFQGGGYPIVFTHDIEDVQRFDIDPDDFLGIDLRGGMFSDMLAAVFEELWIWILSTIASVFAVIFGANIIPKKKNEKRAVDTSF